MQHQRLFVTGAILVGIAAVGAVAYSSGPWTTQTRSSTIDETITAVHIDVRSGGVTLNGTPGTDGASVERRMRAWGDIPEYATYEVDDGVLVLRGCGRFCSVDYVVDLPEGLPVTGETSNGAIDLRATGAVDVRTSNGRISIEDVEGPISARTSNGRIVGTGLDGDEPIVARSSNGRIEFTIDSARDVEAKTSNGSIHLTVPDDSYRVSVTTSNGSTEVGVADDPDGEHHLDLRSSNGSITVERS